MDTECIPVPAGDDERLESFSMDAEHGYGVQHDRVWDGSTEDPSTGLCAFGGTPDSRGRCIRRKMCGLVVDRCTLFHCSNEMRLAKMLF